MNVVHIGPSRGRLGHRRVVLDTGGTFRLRPEDVNALGLATGADIDETALAQVRARGERALAEETVYRLLAIRPRSRRELADRLRRRGLPAEVVAAVITDLEHAGLVDDHRFADAWVRSRTALQPSGRVRLRYELARKGVAREVIDRTLRERLSEQDEDALAQDVARSRLRRYRGLSREVAARRLAGLLERRGFSTSVIARVLRDTVGSLPQDTD